MSTTDKMLQLTEWHKVFEDRCGKLKYNTPRVPGRLVRAFREMLDLSEEDFAFIMGTRTGQVRSWEASDCCMSSWVDEQDFLARIYHRFPWVME